MTRNPPTTDSSCGIVKLLSFGTTVNFVASSVAKNVNVCPGAGAVVKLRLIVTGFAAVAVMFVVVALIVSASVASASRLRTAPSPSVSESRE